MAVPARPTAGGVVESSWGQVAHDTAVGVVGCSGTSPATTVNTTGAVLSPVVTRGRASMLVGQGIVAPMDGLYEVVGYFAASPNINQVWRAFIESDQSGSFANVGFGIAFVALSGWSAAMTVTALLFLSAGKQVRFKGDSSAALNVSLAGWTVAYRGADLA